MKYNSYVKQDIKKPNKAFFETLSNEVRWNIVHLLKGGEYKATDIAKELGQEQSLVSHHLRRLESCGFVFVKKNGKERIYKLNEETIKPLLKMADMHINKFCKKLCS